MAEDGSGWRRPSVAGDKKRDPDELHIPTPTFILKESDTGRAECLARFAREPPRRAIAGRLG